MRYGTGINSSVRHQSRGDTTGTATQVIDAPNIDGGMRYGPGDVLLYTTWQSNNLCQVKPGSAVADKILSMDPLGVFNSSGGLGVVPAGFPDAGGLRITSYDGNLIYSTSLVPDGNGTFDLGTIQMSGAFPAGVGAESVLFAQASEPSMNGASMFLNEFNSGVVSVMDLDANSAPVVATRRVFLDMMGAHGSVRDPLTGHLLFTAYSSSDLTVNRVALVKPKSTMDAYCFGDGSGTPCPCGNVSQPGQGCANSVNGVDGAVLDASGTMSLGAGNLVLSASGLPASQPGLFFQANNAVNGGQGNLFGDGLRCAGGSVVRLQVVPSSASGSAASSIDLGAAGNISAGDVRRYQYWYRDPSGSPCASSFNLTNGLEGTWEL